MLINRAALKSNAKLDMRQAKPSVYLVTLVFLLISLLFSFLGIRVVYGWDYSIYDIADSVIQGYSLYLSPRNGIFGSIISLILELMMLIVGYGYLIFCLNVSRHCQASYGNLLDGFGFFFKALWLYIQISVRIFLWTLLFIIPGIIASFRYSQAMFIMIDHPEWSAGACIRESSNLMQGHKWEYFVLGLSFILWSFLTTLIPFAAIYTVPYMQITMANYYNALLGLRGIDTNAASQQDGTCPPPEGDRDPWDL